MLGVFPEDEGTNYIRRRPSRLPKFGTKLRDFSKPGLDVTAGDARRYSATGDMSLQVPQQRRKFSIPAALQQNLLGLPQSSARRRLSNVSDVITRKFSDIGWARHSSIPTTDIILQGKTLCGQYVRCRLKRSNMFNRKCGLQRLRSAASLPASYVVREVFPELLHIGVELERLHPELYTGVGRQASSTPILATEKAINNVITGVAHELSNSGMTWAKVVSLYAVAGGLAVDCVRQGHPEFLQSLVESVGEALEDDIAEWIAHNGGWTGLLSYCKPPNNEISLGGFVALLGAAMTTFLVVVVLLRWYGRFNYF
ncbi:bcl-2-related ovarian killer protein homolog B-like isoform X2 [Macrosteles quadrilineatus]|uniref:bcl-2-related ovarian killer protein homolog B-like isoform X2 n=1 Tax=Macrosteles quadrilineatus TaxID=74068 RepID=UPI0023E2E9B2|nr:bcl-2-related ovarian killer protein homolog B-like isoform X2 [Macrosteles quadrilineatus]